MKNKNEHSRDQKWAIKRSKNVSECPLFAYVILVRVVVFSKFKKFKKFYLYNKAKLKDPFL